MELAANPDSALSLSELARRLDISKSSCQALVGALVDDGFIVRDAVAYRLGPELIHLGEAAKDAQQLPRLVTETLQQLRDRLGVTAIATVQSGMDLVVVAAAEADHPWGMSIRLGQRIPYRAPFGQAWAAWADRAGIDAWLDNAERELSAEERSAFRESLALVRRRGYSVTVPHDRRTEPRPGSHATRPPWPTPYASEGLSTRSLELPESGGDESWTVAGIGVPVHDGSDRLACVVGLAPFPSSMNRDEIDLVAEEVLRAAGDIGRRLATRTPTSSSSPALLT